MKYTVDYFINKFEAIPESKIGSGSIEKHCPLWHCQTEEAKKAGAVDYPVNEEGLALVVLFGGKDEGNMTEFRPVWEVADGPTGGLTPKERILNKLKSLK